MILWRLGTEGFVLTVNRHNTGFCFLSWHFVFILGNIFSPLTFDAEKENVANNRKKMEGARAPVTTRPTKTGKPRKVGKKERVYGACD
jgi:hypothetical protein